MGWSPFARRTAAVLAWAMSTLLAATVAWWAVGTVGRGPGSREIGHAVRVTHIRPDDDANDRAQRYPDRRAAAPHARAGPAGRRPQLDRGRRPGQRLVPRAADHPALCDPAGRLGRRDQERRAGRAPGGVRPGRLRDLCACLVRRGDTADGGRCQERRGRVRGRLIWAAAVGRTSYPRGGRPPLSPPRRPTTSLTPAAADHRKGCGPRDGWGL